MMKKEHNVILTNRIRFARLLFCGIILCSNFISSQQSPKISSHFKDEEISFSSQSGVFIEQGTIVYDGLKEEKATSKKEKLLFGLKKFFYTLSPLQKILIILQLLSEKLSQNILLKMT